MAVIGRGNNPDYQTDTTASIEDAKAAAHIFGGNIPKEKTVHDIATPDAKQKMAEQVDVLNADAAQKALQVCQHL